MQHCPHVFYCSTYSWCLHRRNRLSIRWKRLLCWYHYSPRAHKKALYDPYFLHWCWNRNSGIIVKFFLDAHYSYKKPTLLSRSNACGAEKRHFPLNFFFGKQIESSWSLAPQNPIKVGRENLSGAICQQPVSTMNLRVLCNKAPTRETMEE